MHPGLRRALSAIVSVYTLMETPARAGGVDELLSAALAHDPALAAAHARAERAATQVGQARSGLLPTLTATAGYTRNQVAAEVALPGQDPVVITPIDQLDATLRAELALLDPGAVAATSAAARCRDAAVAREASEVSDALQAVVRSAWDLHTAERSIAVSQAAVDANTALRDDAAARRDAGTGSALDVLRATADLERARESLALSGADRARAARALAARTGSDALPADLAPRALAQGPLDATRAPAVQAAAHDAACRVAERAQQAWGYAPTVSAFAQERLTNAQGFAGRADTWAAGVSLRWSLFDGGAREARVSGAAAAVREAEANARASLQQAIDALAQAHDDRVAAEAALQSAAARRAAAAEALRTAQERYAAGLGAASDVSLAVRDDQDAALAFAQAEARAAVAVEAERAAAGLPLVLSGGAP
jgi:outer membrane protein TolC